MYNVFLYFFQAVLIEKHNITCFFLKQIADPLEQFSVFTVFCPHSKPFWFPAWRYELLVLFWTNSSITILTGLVLFCLFDYSSATNTSKILPSIFRFLGRIVSETVFNNVKAKTFPFYLFCSYMFLFILIFNLFGMLTYSLTLTSSLLVTFYLASTFFLGTNIWSVGVHKTKMLKLFVPSGVPFIILPVLMIIEIISFSSKIISLAVRLFANMLSGHALLKILFTFFFELLPVLNFDFCRLSSFDFFYLGKFQIAAQIIKSAHILLMAILILEYLIGFLQALVFLILNLIYINDGIYLH